MNLLQSVVHCLSKLKETTMRIQGYTETMVLSTNSCEKQIQLSLHNMKKQEYLRSKDSTTLEKWNRSNLDKELAFGLRFIFLHWDLV